MFISGAKFEKHSFNISRDIVYSVFYNFSCKPYEDIIFLIPNIESCLRVTEFETGSHFVVYTNYYYYYCYYY